MVDRLFKLVVVVNMDADGCFVICHFRFPSLLERTNAVFAGVV